MTEHFHLKSCIPGFMDFSNAII